MIKDKSLAALDELLLSLPGNDGMLLSEFDGLCAGLIVCPQMIPPSEWLPRVWGSDRAPDFDTEASYQDALDLIMGHYNEVARSLMPPEMEYGPVLDQDRRTGGILWKMWVRGFEQAMRLRMDAWEEIIKSADEEAGSSVMMMLALHEIANDESDLPQTSIEELTAKAPDLIVELVIAFNRWTKGHDVPETAVSFAKASAPTAPFRGKKAGRNDPCPCGSGRKYKRCCGSN